ncbi:hypothetical protein ODS41_07680 [Pyrobaculum sp. 3827-6]|uniref:hypothetical protein n=1 Tax=Pyrobaculum sp. 3827-6 TaxID=2983604 RepID=UPI0021DAD7B0|nr:hypothetical protein [Pyrobaculum sp. 3827-6]MCU7787791.1 hypothetical protein [Pyrobaculum sp. 3827-6]
MPNSKLMLAVLATALIAMATSIWPDKIEIAAVPGTNPTVLYNTCYPNACTGNLWYDHWPFGGTPPLALVAIGSPAYGDFYNITRQLVALGLNVDPSFVKRFNNNGTNTIGIGFTQFGEFAATINYMGQPLGGGLSFADYNRPNLLSRYETWTTQIVQPKDWINGWTLSLNITFIPNDPTLVNYKYITIHAFATYSNRTHAGGGRGVVLNITNTQTPTPPNPLTLKNWIYFPLQSSGLRIIYDSPRLLVANGSSYASINLESIDPTLPITVNLKVWYTLIFPKAWPYAIIYYNYTVSVTQGKLTAGGQIYLNSTAFSIRYEIDQVNAAGPASSNATIFAKQQFCGKQADILHALPSATQFRNITMFTVVYPSATEYSVYAPDYIAPVSIPFNYRIVLPTGTARATYSPAPFIPFVIHQWKYRLDKLVPAPGAATYSGGAMFIYGYTRNMTNWAELNKPDLYISSLVEYTILGIPKLYLPSFGDPALGSSPGGNPYHNKTYPHILTCSGVRYIPCPQGGACIIEIPGYEPVYGVVGAYSFVGDVLALGFVTRVTYYMAFDVAPTDYAGSYPPAAINLPNFGGFAVVLGLYPGGSFIDNYGRAGLARTIFAGRFNVSSTSIVTVGGPVPNLMTRYAQDFFWFVPFVADYAGVKVYAPPGTYYADSAFKSRLVPTVWNNMTLLPANTAWPPQYGGNRGLGVVGSTIDPNGTVIVQVWGMSAQDTYWTAWALQYLPSNIPGYYGYNAYLFSITYYTSGPYTYLPQRVDVYVVDPVVGIRPLGTLTFGKLIPPKLLYHSWT